jgi:hypothetical protein
MKIELCRQIFEKYSDINFMEMWPVLADYMQTDMNRHDGANSRIS